MEEVWKDIEGYGGLYQVSNLGNVRSTNWRRLGVVKNIYLKPHNRGYLQVELTNGEKKKTYLVHQLVAKAFLLNPDNLSCVNHIDENKQNNNICNLEWCDQSYNTRYSISKHPNKKRRNSLSSKKILQISKDGHIEREWTCSREIELVAGMSNWSISQCCRGKRKTAYGYIWRYANEYQD